MKAMNKYYYGSNDCVQKKDEKIRDREDYKKYAKRFSTELEEQFKESYEMYHNEGLEGITMTGDHVEQIRIRVDSYFEQVGPLTSTLLPVQRWIPCSVCRMTP